jgi:hypothetical protein
VSQLLNQPTGHAGTAALEGLAGQIHRGLGVVVRWDGVAMVIPSDAAHDTVVDDMLHALGPAPTRGSVVKSVNELLATERLKAVALVVESDSGLAAMVFGRVEILHDGELVLSGGSSATRLELPADAARITIRAANLAKAAEPVAPYDLRRGIAPGAGLTLVPDPTPATTGGLFDAPPAAEPAAELPPAPEPAPQPPAETAEPEAEDLQAAAAAAAPPPAGRAEQPAPTHAPPVASTPSESAAGSSPSRVTHLGATSVPLTGPTVKGHNPLPPLPLATDQDSTVDVLGSADSTEVEGIICARNHFNNPANATCMVCGLSLAHLSDERVRGPRPTLGFIVFDDGATFGLDRSYVIGREPQPSDEVEAEGLVVRSDNETLSRTHAELRLIGWQVHLVDRGSTNGTYIWNSLTEEWVQLGADAPVELHSGATVALGRRTFVFEGVGG